ncbi:MAG: M20/M25/M40 family metallo-hydrolase [Gammaproteobacteria bacterium]|nr:M20/M25/M40 family metallo-hydrolase [Gammaproteobacteria bacterium]NND38660.1 M20/M25/M40 family metallo-hydrolase [Pseudomonadales bacterium]MBT8150400.1 M20/M25/M40 family metallo-hydrolase [Gammaproteobacteria bacterium]NNL11728.1 M20/M25/M40 family metallo-hydrolase [Pseudomonadales bacterium]NNM11738.1 M20/M25/M40 family metallo-hydrolase [Pseudomonadales bacterium]
MRFDLFFQYACMCARAAFLKLALLQVALLWLALPSLALVVASSASANAAQPASLSRMAEALRYPTVSFQDKTKIDYAQFDAFVAFLERSYPATFANLHVERFSKYSLLLRWPGTNSAATPVLFDAHYDVVPIEPGTLKDWPQPPFAGKVSDGYLWGRGVIDDKLAVIAYFEAIEGLQRNGYRPTRDLYFSIVHDEEIGGEAGAVVLTAALAQRGISFPYMVGEGGAMIEQTPWLGERPMAMIALAEKTYVTFSLHADAEGGHSSMPSADSAIARLATAVTRVHENPLPPRLQSPIIEMLDVLGAEVGGVQGWMMRNLWLGRPFVLNALGDIPANNAMVRSTAALTMFDAGVKENVIPQRASAKINMRLLPGFSVEDAVAAIKKIIDDERISISTDSWGQSPPVAPMDGEGYARISRAIQEVFPEALVVPGLLVASTDTRHYQRICPSIYRFRPFQLPMGDTARIHSTGERLATASVVKSVELMSALIKSAGAP